MWFQHPVNKSWNSAGWILMEYKLFAFWHLCGCTGTQQVRPWSQTSLSEYYMCFHPQFSVCIHNQLCRPFLTLKKAALSSSLILFHLCKGNKLSCVLNCIENFLKVIFCILKEWNGDRLGRIWKKKKKKKRKGHNITRPWMTFDIEIAHHLPWY